MTHSNRIRRLGLITCYLVMVGMMGSAWLYAETSGSASIELEFAHAVPGWVQSAVPQSVDRQIVDPHLRRGQSKGLWRSYHSHALPIAVGFFFLSFSGWSLLGVENGAIRKRS